jgi:hypothetical protein
MPRKPFVKSDPRAGRKPASRSRLSNTLIQDLYDEWMEGGKDALRIMRIEEPAQFVKCALATLPREWLIESVTGELGDEELDEMIVRIREQLAKPQDAPLMIEAKVNGDDRATEVVERD